ncbi:MAG: hypothetical protein VX265_16430, partial [Myxococcota bacterium]|nr:hypothetical protein [Myxococcota bacterium]
MLPLLLSMLAMVAHADPSALADRAVAANPALQALQHQAAALSARAEVAGAWSDPVVGVEYSNVPVLEPTLRAHPMGGLQFRVQQQLQTAGWSAA